MSTSSSKVARRKILSPDLVARLQGEKYYATSSSKVARRKILSPHLVARLQGEKYYVHI